MLSTHFAAVSAGHQSGVEFHCAGVKVSVDVASGRADDAVYEYHSGLLENEALAVGVRAMHGLLCVTTFTRSGFRWGCSSVLVQGNS